MYVRCTYLAEHLKSIAQGLELATEQPYREMLMKSQGTLLIMQREQ